ncbi:MAG: hypothetical protein HY240_07765 [Actinobacteria bacterium]|nr:hypothetical protein [Actinomycetota bacterium]
MNILAAFGFDVSAPVLVLAFVYLALIGVAVTSAGLYLAYRLLRAF